MKKKKSYKVPLIVQKAFKALKIAVAKTIEDHRRTGDPIVIWRDGKVVWISASRIKTRPKGV